MEIVCEIQKPTFRRDEIKYRNKKRKKIIMAIPDYQTLMLPVLQKAVNGEVRIRDVVEQIIEEFDLTEEEKEELLPSGRQTVISNRTHWAKTYLYKAGLVESTRRGYFKITEAGKKVLAQKPDKIDNNFLNQFEEFVAFRTKDTNEDQEESPTLPDSDKTPDEVMRLAHQEINRSLGLDLLDRVREAPPEFFENLIVSLLLEMGYGGTAEDAGRALGKSGDDGIDGVIDQDPLGLDRIYVQAKRYAENNSVGSEAIRDFFGSLDRFRAGKGIFVTTSSFTSSAKNTASMLSKRIVLIDGKQLASLMIRYNVGCRIEEILHLKKIDEDFFE